LGVVPLITLEIAVALHLSDVHLRLAFISYAAIIISFICGIHWAICLFFPNLNLPGLLLQSNVITHLGWLAILLDQHQLSIAVLCFCFIYMIGIDVYFYRKGIPPRWFLDLRMVASGCVIVFLVINWVFF